MLNLNFSLLKDFNTHGWLRADYLDGAMTDRGFKLIGWGKHRRTYLSPNGRYVLKFPIAYSGIRDNMEEHHTWHLYKNSPSNIGVLYAPCRIIDGFVLMMWACHNTCGWSDGDNHAVARGMLKRIGGAPYWAEYIDCMQVGMLHNGKIVAFDYAL